jgi:putative multiple sugar transport system permease protein
LELYACAVFIIATVLNNVSKKKKGYATENAVSLYSKLVDCLCNRDAFDVQALSLQGNPVHSALVIVIVAIYTYNTAKTTFGPALLRPWRKREKADETFRYHTNRIYFSAYVNVSFLSALAAIVGGGPLHLAPIPPPVTNLRTSTLDRLLLSSAALSAYGGIGKVSAQWIGAVLDGRSQPCNGTSSA